MNEPDRSIAAGERRLRREQHRRQVKRRRLTAMAVLGAILFATIAALASGGGPDVFERAVADTVEERRNRPVRLTVEANGDLLIHSQIYTRALALGGGRRYDFQPMLREIQPWVEQADLALCHVETPMTSAPPAGYPVFNTPPDLARSIKAVGWDACSTASNHTLDKGAEGIDETLGALDRAGVRHYGSARSAAEADRPTIVDVKGMKVGLLAYTEMTNGIPVPDRWSVNLAEAPRILADARRAREAGARVVIVNLHWGEEFQQEPSAAQLRLARTLARSDDITAIVGQHIHAAQPIQRVEGKIVVFGEGNLISAQTAACCPAASQDGFLALLDLVVVPGKASVERVRYVPVYVRNPDYTVLPVGEALERGEGSAAELRESYKRTVSVVGRGPGIEPVPARLP